MLRWKLLACLLCAVPGSSLALADGNARDTPLVRAVRQSQKSVVNIHTEKTAADDKDSRFFTPKSRKVTGMGTGIIVDEHGYIVTNYHVIQDVELITVTLQNGSTFDARPVSFDRKHDLAIIRITSTEPLSVMPLGTSSDVMLAETVYAVGNAYGYEHTITSGIISAIHRDVEVDETQSYENLIQTDAAINPGNSGGPLINLNGEVIGINVAIRSGAQRIGFAIPIDDARRTISRLLSVERLNGMAHGLTTTDIKSATEKKLRVDAVQAGSASAACGIQPGDIVRSVRGVAVLDATDLERSLLDLPRGKVVDVVLDRNGKEERLAFTVGAPSTAGAPVVAVSQPSTTGDLAPQSAELPTVSVSGKDLSAEPDPVSAEKLATAQDHEQILVRAWDLLGLRLAPLSEIECAELATHTFPGVRTPIQYKGGMRVVSIRPQCPASRFVKDGDILVGLDGFETLGPHSLLYILGEEQLVRMASPIMKCQVYRQGSNPLEGTISLSSRPSHR